MPHINSKILAAALAVSAPLISTSARADTWGCEVLLCLSNPAGPMAVTVSPGFRLNIYAEPAPGGQSCPGGGVAMRTLNR